MDPHYHPFLVIALVAVLAPLLAELPLRFRIPGVVLEIACGILVGPHVLDLVRPDGVVKVLWEVGLFLLARIEIDFNRIRGRPLNLAAGGWVVSSCSASSRRGSSRSSATTCTRPVSCRCGWPCSWPPASRRSPWNSGSKS